MMSDARLRRSGEPSEVPPNFITRGADASGARSVGLMRAPSSRSAAASATARLLLPGPEIYEVDPGEKTAGEAVAGHDHAAGAGEQQAVGLVHVGRLVDLRQRLCHHVAHVALAQVHAIVEQLHQRDLAD